MLVTRLVAATPVLGGHFVRPTRTPLRSLMIATFSPTTISLDQLKAGCFPLEESRKTNQVSQEFSSRVRDRSIHDGTSEPKTNVFGKFGRLGLRIHVRSVM